VKEADDLVETSRVILGIAQAGLEAANFLDYLGDRRVVKNGGSVDPRKSSA
jgi:hypothetical protein